MRGRRTVWVLGAWGWEEEPWENLLYMPSPEPLGPRCDQGGHDFALLTGKPKPVRGKFRAAHLPSRYSPRFSVLPTKYRTRMPMLQENRLR